MVTGLASTGPARACARLPCFLDPGRCRARALLSARGLYGPPARARPADRRRLSPCGVLPPLPSKVPSLGTFAREPRVRQGPAASIGGHCCRPAPRVRRTCVRPQDPPCCPTSCPDPRTRSKRPHTSDKWAVARTRAAAPATCIPRGTASRTTTPTRRALRCSRGWRPGAEPVPRRSWRNRSVRRTAGALRQRIARMQAQLAEEEAAEAREKEASESAARPRELAAANRARGGAARPGAPEGRPAPRARPRRPRPGPPRRGRRPSSWSASPAPARRRPSTSSSWARWSRITFSRWSSSRAGTSRRATSAITLTISSGTTTSETCGASSSSSIPPTRAGCSRRGTSCTACGRTRGCGRPSFGLREQAGRADGAVPRELEEKRARTVANSSAARGTSRRAARRTATACARVSNGCSAEAARRRGRREGPARGGAARARGGARAGAARARGEAARAAAEHAAEKKALAAKKAEAEARPARSRPSAAGARGRRGEGARGGRRDLRGGTLPDGTYVKGCAGINQ